MSDKKGKRNAGKRWSEDEEKEMLQLVRSGKTTYEIAKALGRSQYAITLRLEAIGVKNVALLSSDDVAKSNEIAKSKEVEGEPGSVRAAGVEQVIHDKGDSKMNKDSLLEEFEELNNLYIMMGKRMKKLSDMLKK